MSYTNVPKPTGPTYTKVQGGYVFYDDLNFMYDDPSMYYDGYNPFAYTDIAKPSSTTYINVPKPT